MRIQSFLNHTRRYTTSNFDALVIVNQIGAVRTIGLNRPQKRNCINPELATGLESAIVDFENDESSYVAVLHGMGGNFCSGYDLNSLAEMKDKNNSIIMGPTRRIIKKPVVAALSGYAVAGGMELALMCDLRVMEDTAVIGAFNRRFGAPFTNGGTVRLQKIIGFSRAMDMILTGRPVTAKEAFSWGLADRIVACGTSLGQAINLATCLVKFPQKCMNADRMSTYYSAFNSRSLEDSFRFEQENAKPVFAEEAVEGAKKFLAGAGKHGKFNDVAEHADVKDWEREQGSTHKL